jgi:hypothetical protein
MSILRCLRSAPAGAGSKFKYKKVAAQKRVSPARKLERLEEEPPRQTFFIDMNPRPPSWKFGREKCCDAARGT